LSGGGDCDEDEEEEEEEDKLELVTNDVLFFLSEMQREESNTLEEANVVGLRCAFTFAPEGSALFVLVVDVDVGVDVGVDVDVGMSVDADVDVDIDVDVEEEENAVGMREGGGESAKPIRFKISLSS
jgi:hypothetical protein